MDAEWGADPERYELVKQLRKEIRRLHRELYLQRKETIRITKAYYKSMESEIKVTREATVYKRQLNTLFLCRDNKPGETLF